MECAKDGCRAHALKDDQFCFQHSQRPDIVSKRLEARRRGGSRGKIKVTDNIETIADIKRIIAETLSELRSSGTGDMVAKARAIGYLCGVALTAFEKADLEERIAKLESSLTESMS